MGDPKRWPTPTSPITSMPVPVPSSFQVTGKEGFFIVQWAPISSVDGYDIAVMTNLELDTPNIGIFRQMGYFTARWDYHVGNIVLTRFFAVRAFKDVDYGKWTAIKSATCALTTAAGSAEPTNPASPVTSTPPPPASGEEDPGRDFRYGTVQL